MITRLAVHGFQSLHDAELELGQVNLIVGQNFSGKSALIRALASLCFNRQGEEFIRKPEDHALVALSWGGHAAAWFKPRGKSASYELDERTFSKTGASVPEEVAAALGIREIEVDKNWSISPQIQRQFDTPFLIGESGSRIARVLGKLTRLDVIVQAQVSCRRDRDRFKREAETAAGEEERHQESLDALPDLTSARESYEMIAQALDKASQLLQESELAREASKQLKRAQARAAVDLNPTKVELGRASLALGRLEEETALVAQLRLARTMQERGEEGVKRQTKALSEARTAYDKLCEKAKVCETCPWRAA